MHKSIFALFGLSIFITFQSCSASESDEKTTQENETKTNLSSNSDSLDWIVDELIIKWNNNKDYCIETLEAMPESNYDFVPAEPMHSFSEQATHVIETMHWQMEKLGFTELPEFKNGSKADLIESYNALFDYLISELEKMPGDELTQTVGVFYGESSKRRLLNLLDNHVAHHIGEMVVYLRLKGVTPPKFRGW